MVLKGVIHSIPDEVYLKACQAAISLIMTQGITTICWDGDPMTYPNPNTGEEATASFTRLLDVFQKLFPQLEFIYFKKVKSIDHLLSDVITAPQADHRNNWLGAYSFLNTRNTQVRDGDALITAYTEKLGVKNMERSFPSLSRGRHYAISFEPDWGEKGYHHLGLRGLRFIKSVLRLDNVSFMFVGKGSTLQKELEEVDKNPSLYPAGVTEAISFAVHRDSKSVG